MSPVLSRPRIDRLLGAAWERRITLVVAGGGYGKTTALRELASDGRSRWLSLKGADRTVESLAPRVAAALDAQARAAETVAVAALGAPDRRRLAEGQAAAILESFDARTDEVLIAIDELERLADDDSSSRFLSTLCLQAPSRLHIVLSGSRVPALGLGAARGRGELTEVTAQDLAFDPAESAALLVERLGPPARDLADECWRLTAGWPAALQLLADHLERLEAARWQPALEQLRRRRGPIWREFAADLLAREEPPAQRILAVAGVVPLVEADLLRALGVSEAGTELDSLQARGLMVPSGERGALALSPVLVGAAAERVAAGEATVIRRDTAAWFEHADRLEEALECAVGGAAEETLAFLVRCGEKLVARGYGSRVAEILGELGTAGRLALDRVLAEALVAVGDWDRALEVFRSIERTSAEPLDSAIAWRFGALLYLRSETQAAREILSAAYREGAGSSDDALVAAWLSSVLWSCGEADEAARVAETARAQAEAGGEPAALAAAHVAAALVAASRGERELNSRHYRRALNAATRAEDSVQLARIHANLSSRAMEEGDYAGAIEEADLAISAAAGHNLFSALAMSNKAEALMRTGELEEARALLGQAIEMFTSLGSLLVCAPLAERGALEAERGDFARARKSLERAYRLAEEADDVHSVVVALARLAAVMAESEPHAARAHATQAVERATSLERAAALCALAWVELSSGNLADAARVSADAQAEARRTGDNPSLARALELAAAACEPVDQAQLESAVELWRELRDPIALNRAELMVAVCRGLEDRASDLRSELARRGAHAELGPAGLLLRARERPVAVTVTTLGRFSVSREHQAIPLAVWQSRKARDLLKILAARRGRPLTREAAGELLWPGEDPAAVSNRLSVALSTLRRVLDPERAYAPDHFVAADNQSVVLRTERVSLDVADFLGAAAAGIALASQGDWGAAERELRRAETLYTGDFLEEDVYEDWAVDCREEARSAAQDVTRLLARAAVERRDEEEAVRYLRRLLESDPYDADAWAALLGAHLRLKRYGEARRGHALYARRMRELAIPALPLAQMVDTRP
jgi:ATP/maltotriose-dependent transcriptional regulator MalT/DNA-binding SARP family transcriptional activator